MKKACKQCKLEYETDHMVQFSENYVCAGCKDSYVQKIREGADVPPLGSAPMPQRDFRAIRALLFLVIPTTIITVIAVGITLRSPVVKRDIYIGIAMVAAQAFIIWVIIRKIRMEKSKTINGTENKITDSDDASASAES